MGHDCDAFWIYTCTLAFALFVCFVWFLLLLLFIQYNTNQYLTKVPYHTLIRNNAGKSYKAMDLEFLFRYYSCSLSDTGISVF